MQVVNDTDPTPACAWLSFAAGFFARPTNSLKLAGRKILARDDKDGCAGREADGLEILDGVVLRFG